MKSRWLCSLFGLVVILVLLSGSASAGQVVTQEVTSWARKAIEEEKTPQAIPSRNTVAVPYFQNRTGRTDMDPLQRGIPLMLMTDLSKVKGLQVIERVRLQALMEELGLGKSGLVEAQTAPRIGKLLGAKWLVGGTISGEKAPRIRIQSAPLDVLDQKVLGRPVAEGDPEDLFRIEKDLLLEIIKLLNIKLEPGEEEELRKPCSTNLRALLSLFRAIEASDFKDYEKAAELYERALKEDPNICEARGALQELKALGLISGEKKSREMLRSLRDRSSLTDQLTPEDATKRIRTPKDVPAGRQRTGVQ
jgi:TolB-like protein